VKALDASSVFLAAGLETAMKTVMCAGDQVGRVAVAELV
jgi:hypothetical protein